MPNIWLITYDHHGASIEMQWTTFPWALNSSNHLCDEDQLRPVTIPDIKPAEIVCNSGGRMSMAAGDFVEIFQDEEFEHSFDAVVTCFFLDTAHNPISYLETIHKVLKVRVYTNILLLF